MKREAPPGLPGIRPTWMAYGILAFSLLLTALAAREAARVRGGESMQGAAQPFSVSVLFIGIVISLLAFWVCRVRSRALAAAERHAETERSAEARYRRLVEQSIVGIYVIQGDRFTYVNPKMADVFGCTAEELTSRPLLEFIAEASRPVTQANIEKRLRGEVESIHYELRGLRCDGTVIELEAHGGRVEYNGQPAILGSLVDITTRKRAEAEVKRQRADLQLVLDAVPAMIFYKDAGHRLVRVNEETARVSGQPREAIEGRTDQELGRPHAEQYYRDEDEVMATGQAKRGIIEPLDAPGGLRWLQTDKIPYRDESGGIVGVIGFAVDITVRKEAEEKLQAQLRRLDLLSRITRAIAERHDLASIHQVVIRSLEENLPLDFCCICLYEPLAKVLTVAQVGIRSGPLARELALLEQAQIPIDPNGLARCVQGELMYEPEISASAFPFPQRLARGGLRAFVAAPLLVESQVFGALIAARRAPESFSSGECEFLRQLSEHVALAAHQAQLHGALQQAYDDLRRTQQAVMQQERLRVMGQMASGIAHDINNAISPASLYTEALIDNEPGLSARAQRYLQSIQQAIDDVAKTVGRMREFYRPRELEVTPTPVALSRVAQQILDLTEVRWRDMPQQQGIMIEPRTEFAPDLPLILGVESEIRDALTNLILNAVDAMPEGGTLTLRTRLADSAAGDGASPGPRVHLEVADTGHGMDEETRRRCLEPFYTTKGERGTGLGLAMVYGAIQRHGGEIEIESTKGAGTTVCLAFPLPSASAPALPASPQPAAPVRPLRLLVVDDDPLLIVSLREILSDEGHDITTATGGQAGIDAFLAAQETRAPFEAVLTDLGMPHVDGRQVATTIKNASPATPVILLTGWGQRIIAEGNIPPGVDRVLSKPPTARALREALAACCAGMLA